MTGERLSVSGVEDILQRIAANELSSILVLDGLDGCQLVDR